MKAYELFKSQDTEKVLDALVKSPGFFNEVDWNNTISDERKKEIKEKITDMYRKEVENIKSDVYSVSDMSDSILLVMKRKSDEDSYYETARFYKNDFDKANKIDKTKPEEFKNPLVSVLFNSRSDVLSTEVSEVCINRYGADVVCAGILREICFFGIDNVSYEKRQEEERIELEKACEEYDFGEGRPIREVFEELGFVDDRSPEEKEADRKKAYEEALANINETIDLIFETIKIYGREN